MTELAVVGRTVVVCPPRETAVGTGGSDLDSGEDVLETGAAFLRGTTLLMSSTLSLLFADPFLGLLSNGWISFGLSC